MRPGLSVDGAAGAASAHIAHGFVTPGLPMQENRAGFRHAALTLPARAAKMRRGGGGTAAATFALWRRRRADRDQRRVRRIGFNAAGNLPFADIGRRVARRSAIGAHQYFVAAARSRAAADQAVQPNNANGRTGRTLLALRARRAGRADRPGRSGRAGIAFGTGRTLRSGVAFRTLCRNRQVRAPTPQRAANIRPAFLATYAWEAPRHAPHNEWNMPGKNNKLCRPFQMPPAAKGAQGPRNAIYHSRSSDAAQ